MQPFPATSASAPVTTNPSATAIWTFRRRIELEQRPGPSRSSRGVRKFRGDFVRTFVIAIGVVAAMRAAQAQSPRAGGPAPGDSAGETRIGAEANLAGNIARGFVDRELVAARGILQGWTGP